MKKNCILLLGGTGFLGYYLYKNLRKIKKYKIIRQSRKKFAEVIFDPSNIKKLFKNLKKIKPDIIINLISCTK